MAPEELHRSFPNDAPLPDLLVRLCVYTEEQGHRRTLAEDLVLNSEGHDFLEDWFGGDVSAATQFIVFASDDADALYGYWRHDGQPLDQAPLVYLNDEGAYNTVLASTLQEFLTLVGVGQKFLGRFERWDEHAVPDNDTLRYHDWLRSELGVEPPTLDEARAIIERARGQHPDLDAWVEQSLVAAG